MLDLILGKAASGKTVEICKRIEAEARAGNKNIILITPEQYTFETERQMLSLLGSGFMSTVQVLSFTRMCETVGQIYGGISGIRIDEAQRQILMGRAVKNTFHQLSVFKKYVKTPDFIRQSSEIISEFKQAGISAIELTEAANKTCNKSLVAKLNDLSLIYTAYDELIKNVFVDPSDDLEILLKKAEKTDFFDGKTVFIDAFKGFTGSQIKLLHLMILRCKNVTISFCCDGISDKSGGTGVFSNIKSVAAELLKYAKDNHIPVANPTVLDTSYYVSYDLRELENMLSSESLKTYDGGENISLGVFKNPSEEVENVFKTIHRMVRQEGLFFGDFVLIARDINKYERMIESSSKKFNVPCYFDKRRSLMFSPVARFVLAALNAAKSLSSESIFVFLKSGISGFTDVEVSLLEEYVYIWEIDGEAWRNEWVMNPDGFVQSNDNTDEVDIGLRLKKINDLRKKVIVPLLKLKSGFQGGCLEISEAVYNLLMSMGIDKNVKEYCDSLFASGEEVDADFVMESWDAVMSVLDSMVRCYEKDEITVEEYIAMLDLSFSGMTLGSIPRTLDEVFCGSADRIRPARPKVVFVIGLNLGEFPANISENGLLLRNDRILLESAGLKISDRFRSFAIEEKFLLYSSLCCADEKVFAFCHSHTTDGTITEPGTVISKIKNTFKNVEYMLNNYLPETEAEGFAVLAKEFKNPGVLSKSLEAYFNEKTGYKSRLEKITKMTEPGERRISEKLCKKLFKNDIYLSASRIENYNSCAFSYFCRYVLGINRLQKANLDNLQRGTVVHFVLEKVLKKFGKNIAFAGEEEIVDSINFYMNEYLNLIEGSEFLKQPRFEFLYGSIAKMIKYVILHISAEFKNSDFEPACFELTISEKGDIPALSLEFMPGRNVNIVGQIDRVDILKNLEGNNYIRVVDYKTGKKVFYLPEVLYGLNMQMLIYLYAIKLRGVEKFGDFQTAGILYMPSKRGIVKQGEEKGNALQMNGMLVDDDKVLLAMDKAETGEFVPKKSVREREGDPIISGDDFENVFKYVDLMIRKTAKNITDGVFDIAPTDTRQHNACEYCDFSAVCGIEEESERRCVEKLCNSEILEKMKEATENGN